ncbi:hypothetical protein AB1N83_011642 [Pleurotus pulmonarius]
MGLSGDSPGTPESKISDAPPTSATYAYDIGIHGRSILNIPHVTIRPLPPLNKLYFECSTDRTDGSSRDKNRLPQNEAHVGDINT